MAENKKEIIKDLSNNVKKLEKNKDWAQAASVWEKIENLAQEIAWGPAQNQARTAKAECLKKIEEEKAKLEKEQKEKEAKIKEQERKEKEAKLREQERKEKEVQEAKLREQERKEKEAQESELREQERKEKEAQEAKLRDQESIEKEKAKIKQIDEEAQKQEKESDIIDANPFKKNETTKERIKDLSNAVKKLEKEKNWAQAASVWEKIENLCKEISWDSAQIQANNQKDECIKRYEAEKSKLDNERKAKEENEVKLREKDHIEKEKVEIKEYAAETFESEQLNKKEKNKSEQNKELKRKDGRSEPERKEMEKKTTLNSSQFTSIPTRAPNSIEASPFKKFAGSWSERSPEETARIQNEIAIKEQQAEVLMSAKQWLRANQIWHEIETLAQSNGFFRNVMNSQKNQKICTDNQRAEHL